MREKYPVPVGPDPDPESGGIRPSMMLAVAIGGMVGSVARYAIGRVWPVEPGAVPWATLAVNVAGSLLLGVALVVLAEIWPTDSRRRALVSTGVLGALTTMATYAVEVVVLAKDGHAALAFGYIAGSLAAGLAAAAGGIALGHAVVAAVPAREPA